jgi:hypothetical protein
MASREREAPSASIFSPMPASTNHAPRRARKGPSGGDALILLADDHDGLRDSAQEMLQALGYRTMVTRSGDRIVQVEG